MSLDPHERTRLFSVKSFLGNILAMATPWFIFLAEQEFFRGPGGNLIDGMRYVTILVAIILIPLSVWWFVTLREPGYEVAKEQKKSSLLHDIRTAFSNRTFLLLTAIFFVLAVGFNLVNNFANYITIFYLYGGNMSSAGALLGVNGTVWAVTALVAVFPLNWISRRLGKRTALIISILLMCAAQLSKIVCYRRGILFQFDPPQWLYDVWNWLDRWVWLVPAARETVPVEAPYLVLIPTMLLSAGMLMFFTLGSSMVGDVCDEDDFNTGKRSEGVYYSVFWFFIKMGTAVAIFVTGFLLVYTAFDERQNVIVDKIQSDVSVIKANSQKRQNAENVATGQVDQLEEAFDKVIERSQELRRHFAERLKAYPDQRDHLESLIEQNDFFHKEVVELRAESNNLVNRSAELVRTSDALLSKVALLKQQTPKTLFRLRLFEIGLPLVMSCFSILLTLRYPLTEARCYEIKEALKRRHAEQVG
jgi:GPH family glycoside/pentoside/hexuronide:cation symporter